MKKQVLISYILGGLIIAGSIYGVFVYLPKKITEPENHLATVGEGIVQTDQSPQKEKVVDKDNSSGLEIIKALEKEIENLLKRLPEIIVGFPVELIKQVEAIKVKFQSLREEIESIKFPATQPSEPTEPIVEYSDLQPTIEDVPQVISGVSPESEGKTITLLSLSNLGGRLLQLREIFFTTDNNPQFSNLSVSGAKVSEPILGGNGFYYWGGEMNVDSVEDIIVSVAMQSCKPELNNCDWTQLNINVNLADWILWDLSTDRPVNLTGEYKITITSD